MNDPNEVITIYKARNSAEAYMICNALQAEGIQCRVAEANDPLAGLPLADPEVLVHVSDSDRATKFIQQLNL